MISLEKDDVKFDENFMHQALKEAEKAFAADEVPVGCVIAFENRIIGRGYNRVESLQDPTAHAEILAITAAASHLGDWRLTGATVYCTLEPCAMCAGALVLARVERLVFGAPDPKFGACGSIFNIVSEPKTNHRMSVSMGMLRGECVALMQEFFKKKRNPK